MLKAPLLLAFVLSAQARESRSPLQEEAPAANKPSPPIIPGLSVVRGALLKKIVRGARMRPRGNGPIPSEDFYGSDGRWRRLLYMGIAPGRVVGTYAIQVDRYCEKLLSRKDSHCYYLYRDRNDNFSRLPISPRMLSSLAPVEITRGEFHD